MLTFIRSKKEKIFLLILLSIICGGIFWFYHNRVKAISTGGQLFSDVLLDHWAYVEIEAAYYGGIVQGYPDGTYRPLEKVNRAQMAVYIARAVAGGDSKVPAGPAHNSFSDVLTTHWAYKYIEYVKSKGIVGGFADGTYHPNEIVKRDSMAVFIARAIAGSDSKVTLPAQLTNYPDVTSSNWAYRYIQYLSSLGVVKGYDDGKYHPEREITRDQMAVFITKAFNLITSALVANISGKVTSSTGAVLANGYIVINEGEDIVKINSSGNYTLPGLDPTTYEVEIFDANGYLYEAPDVGSHLISPQYGNNTINFSGLIRK